jgi:hypothetical protein
MNVELNSRERFLIRISLSFLEDKANGDNSEELKKEIKELRMRL